MRKLDHELFTTVYLALFLTSVSADCVDLDLGIENGAIPDSEITASSELSANTPAKNGRLNYTLGSSWCAETSDTNPYLQIHLQTLHIIYAVSTQGNSQADQLVKNYRLQLSADGTTRTDYTPNANMASNLNCHCSGLTSLSHM
ncbi:Discoidin domain-containing receptor 2 [Stylophora pistillata]|uniref:Discoidin domain-containing receptor 2 n=1 Tax=Stylophora pistillata TaxID=50429 RepID=A0A2B4R894_STYPI|nr:Discoidin domain-containing receptor 2 [Stylophora pistillata]